MGGGQWGRHALHLVDRAPERPPALQRAGALRRGCRRPRRRAAHDDQRRRVRARRSRCRDGTAGGVHRYRRRVPRPDVPSCGLAHDPVDRSLERVALVSGGSRGIGRACALALAGDGFDVAVNYRRDDDAAADTVAAIESLGRRAKSYRASVESAPEDEAMVAAVLADFGAIDTLVHSAGIASRGHTVADTDPGELERVIAIHALGGHHLCRLVLPSMRTRPRGDVVFVSSVAARILAPNSAPYNMAKAALE